MMHDDDPKETGSKPPFAGRIGACLWVLASDDGSYITGAMIPVTGGRPML
jgi:hypothetical protein